MQAHTDTDTRIHAADQIRPHTSTNKDPQESTDSDGGSSRNADVQFFNDGVQVQWASRPGSGCTSAVLSQVSVCA
jgi:hypothetical protein